MEALSGAASHKPIEPGIGRFPSCEFAINAAWLETSLTAMDLLAWTQTMLLDGELAKAEPKKLRYRLLHTAPRITHGQRQLYLRLAKNWPWARRVSEHLSAHYTVVLYDRRGFSRSQLHGVQDYDRRLETDADDVRRLIEHVSDEPATVFGVSSGGLMGMEVLTNHPSVVHTLVSFEPPLGGAHPRVVRAAGGEAATGWAEVAGLLLRALRSLPRRPTAAVNLVHERCSGR